MKIKLTNKRYSAFSISDESIIKLNKLRSTLGVSKTRIVEVLIQFMSEGKLKKDLVKYVKSKFKPSVEEKVKNKSNKVLKYAKKNKM